MLTELYRADKLGFRNKWEKLASQSAGRGGSTKSADYRRAFEERFLPAVTFVDVTGMFEDANATEAVHRIDPHDAPTGQLAVLLSRMRPIVYSHDHSLWRPSLAPAPANFQAVLIAGREADSSEDLTQGFTYVAGGVVWAVDGAARGVAGILKVPSWLPWLAIAGAIGWYLLGQDRREHLIDSLRPIGRVIQAQMEKSTAALALLSDSVAQVEPEDGIECRIAEVFARESADEALTASEIQERIMLGHRAPIEVPQAGDIRSLMRQRPCFVEGPSSHFHLGQDYRV